MSKYQNTEEGKGKSKLWVLYIRTMAYFGQKNVILVWVMVENQNWNVTEKTNDCFTSYKSVN